MLTSCIQSFLYLKAYRNRLEKRLFSLLVLDQQLQEELLIKTEDVRKARDQVRASASVYTSIFNQNEINVFHVDP